MKSPSRLGGEEYRGKVTYQIKSSGPLGRKEEEEQSVKSFSLMGLQKINTEEIKRFKKRRKVETEGNVQVKASRPFRRRLKRRKRWRSFPSRLVVSCSK